MRIIFLTLGYHPDQVGGAYRYVAEVATRLAARQHEVRVISPAPDASAPLEESRQGVLLRRFPNQEGFFLSNWRRENALARTQLWKNLPGGDEKALIILCHAFFAPALEGMPHGLVYLFTGPWAEEFRFTRQAQPRSIVRRWLDGLIAMRLRAIEREALRSARRILTLSQYYQDQLPRWHGSGLPPVQVIYGGVDHDHFCPAGDRAKLRSRLRIAPDEFLFLTVRRLDPRMGLLALIEAFARASEAFPLARLCLAGSGPQKDALEAQIARLNLGKQIKLLGYVPETELSQWYNAADCTVVPSLDLEGFGLATVESLACGTPAIGSNAGATPELLSPLGKDLLYPAGSVDALAAQLKNILQHPQSLPPREQCHQYARQRFDWEAVTSAVEDCSREI